MKTLVSRLRYDAWSFVARHPSVYFPIARRLNVVRTLGRVSLVSDATELTIEGYPGSGNTRLLALLQRSEMEVAHHTHAIAQLRTSVAKGVPTIVTLRRPEDAVPSFVARQGRISVYQALREYVRFHREVAALASTLLLVTFEDVVARPAQVVGGIDAQFGTTYSRYGVPSELEIEASILAWQSRGISSGRTRTGLDRPAPDEQRDKLKAQHRERLASRSSSVLHKNARELHAALIEMAR